MDAPKIGGLKKTVLEMVSQIEGMKVPGSSTKSGVPYQPFPDFMRIEGPAAQKWQNVWNEYLLVQKLIDSDKFILDIGANIGYFSFMLSHHKNAKCRAIELDRANRRVMEALNEIMFHENYGHKIDVGQTIKFDSGEVFDYTLMLNVHHWIYKEKGAQPTKTLMRKIAKHSGELFFQTAHAESNAFYKVEELKNAESIIAYLHSCGWKDVTLLANTQPEKPRYLFHCKH